MCFNDGERLSGIVHVVMSNDDTQCILVEAIYDYYLKTRNEELIGTRTIRLSRVPTIKDGTSNLNISVRDTIDDIDNKCLAILINIGNAA